MPNWCWNTLSVSHSDPEIIKKFEQACDDSNLFETFAPIGEWDYGLAVEAWGTKWDVNSVDYDTDGDTIHCTFDTAWSPPIGFYNALTEAGFSVSASYHEEGMQFAGIYEDGEEYTVEYDYSDPNWRDGIPEDIVEMLESGYESYLEWQEED